jgi:tetratricopeptide (TPR) repeat protein
MRSPRALFLMGGLLLAGCVGRDASAQDPAEVDRLLAEGNYPDAVELLEDQVAAGGAPEVVAQLAELLVDVGRLEDAEAALTQGLARSPGHLLLELRLGRLYQETGRRDEARAAFERVRDASSGSEGLLAELHLGELLLEGGDQAGALAVFDDFIDVYNSGRNLDSQGLMAVATAVRYLEVTNPALLQDAIRAYDQSLGLDPNNLEAHLAIGMLLIRTYQVADAREAFQEVLARRPKDPRALLGMALAARIEGSLGVGDLLDEALEVNPRLVPALVARAQVRLAGEDLEGAEADLEAALETDPTSSEGLGVQAAWHYLVGRTDELAATTARAMELNPKDALFYVTVSDLLSTRRFYAEAAEYADRGVGLDPLSWPAFGAKGLNELRVGRMEEGRANLEIAFAGDPYNLWYKNTLDLLDLMDTFEVAHSDRITVLVDPEDGQAMAIYLLDMAERAYDALSARYGYRPVPPVRVEAFRRSADFSVRTVGLAGLGALGVAFGTVVAMDSPSARGPDGYHWASTLWHEMAHVVHLGMTDHYVPRWVSEGLAVHEERLAGEGWGARPGLSFFAAYLQERLRPPSELSLAFVRPRFPEEVGFSYILGSLVSEWIEAEWGFDAILGMFERYRENAPQEAVLDSELGVTPEEFDRRFDAWLRERYAAAFVAAEAAVEIADVEMAERMSVDWLEERVAEAPADLQSRVALARLLMEEERPQEAIPYLLEARDLFPENPDPVGPNRVLAEIYTEQGNNAAAEEALVAHLGNTAEDYGAHVQLADLREERGDLQGAADALGRAILVYPFEIPIHERLAGLYETVGDAEGEVRERRVVLALQPVDRAGAFYELAEAQLRAGDREGARSSALSALEVAPRVPEAQDLLLRIMQSGP